MTTFLKFNDIFGETRKNNKNCEYSLGCNFRNIKEVFKLHLIARVQFKTEL